MKSESTRRINDDVMLLRIVVGPEVTRRSNWDEWVDRVDIDHLSSAAYGLLPSLYAAIEPLGVDHPWVARLRGVYRREWTGSQRHLASAKTIGGALSSAGIPHLDPADQQVARFLDGALVPRLDRPRVVVDWWSAPLALGVLRDAGWNVDARPSGESVRQRLTRSSWTLSNSVGASVELATSFLPLLVDERRETDLWERARAVPNGLPGVHPTDLAVAALCDQLDVVGAIRWVPGAVAVIDAPGPLDLRPVLDRRVARQVLPMLGNRLDFLASEGLGRDTGDLRSQIGQLVKRHPVPTSAADRAVQRAKTRARMVRRQPRALREIRHRHGSWAGVVAALRDS